jgi:hypothetical protein
VIRLTLCLLLGLAAGCGTDTPEETCQQSPGQVYDARIAPLLAGPSSCNQCHLSGLSLANFVTGDPCRTMACLAEQGEVNLDDPQQSKILERVLKAEPQSTLITAGVIEAEYVGMLEWITYSGRCQESACGVITNPCAAGGQPAPAVVAAPLGGCSEAELLAGFEARVFAWRNRCGACHSSSGQIPAPEWVDFGSATNSMYNVLGMGAVNVATPHLSTLLTKPLAESHPDGLAHGGGDKFADEADPTYQDLREWIEAYVACFDGSVLPGPTVEILSPKPDAWLAAGEPVAVNGSAQTADGAPITGDSLDWLLADSGSSAGSTSLGKGQTPTLVLPEGRITLTLQATGPDSQSSRRRVNVFVGGACRTPGDLELVQNPEAFDVAIRSCPCGDNNAEACLTQCAEESLTEGCAACAVAYELCGRAQCEAFCGQPDDTCAHCIARECAPGWEHCSGTAEPGAE